MNDINHVNNSSKKLVMNQLYTHMNFYKKKIFIYLINRFCGLHLCLAEVESREVSYTREEIFRMIASAFHSGLEEQLKALEKNLCTTRNEALKIHTSEESKLQNLFVDKYPWYAMPTTMHKILIHGALVIESCLLPIGQLSEEAQEARHKDVKAYRQKYSRKSARTKTMEDVFHWLLVSSDPVITNLRKLPPKKITSFAPEAIQLLIALPRSKSDEDSDEPDFSQ